MEVISEAHIFAALIRKEHTPEELQKLKTRALYLKSRVNENIFKNEWCVFYEVFTRAINYGAVPNLEQANQMLINSIDVLWKSPNINPREFSDNPGDELESKRSLIAIFGETWKELEGMEVGDEDLKTNTEVYLERWASNALAEAYRKSHNIITRGERIGRINYKGPEDSLKYIDLERTRILKVLHANRRTVSIINLSPEGYDEYVSRQEDSPITKVVADFGINSVDSVLGGLRKSDLLCIMAYSGNGKTRMAIDVVYDAVVNKGQSGIYFALEGDPTEYEAKLVAHHLAKRYKNPPVDDDQIVKKTYDPKYHDIIETARRDLFTNPNYGRMLIIPPPFYLEDIEAVLEDFWANWQVYDWICIDHTLLVESRNQERRKDKLDYLYPLLKRIAISFMGVGLLVITCHQLNGEAYEELLKGNNITELGAAESKEVQRSCNIVVTLFNTQEMRADSRSDLYCTKLRNQLGFPKKSLWVQWGSCVFKDPPSTQRDTKFAV